jgi:hypothetical protein
MDVMMSHDINATRSLIDNQLRCGQDSHDADTVRGGPNYELSLTAQTSPVSAPLPTAL